MPFLAFEKRAVTKKLHDSSSPHPENSQQDF
jgi:hypothetical protein